MATAATALKGIFIEVGGTIQPLEDLMRRARALVTQEGAAIANALGGALDTRKINAGLNQLTDNLRIVAANAKIPTGGFAALTADLKEVQGVTGVTAETLRELQRSMLQQSATAQAEKALASLMRQTGKSRDELIAMDQAFASLPSSSTLATRALIEQTKALNLTNQAFGELSAQTKQFKAQSDLADTIRRVGEAAGYSGDQLVEWARTLNVDVAVLQRFRTESEKAAEATYTSFLKMVQPLKLVDAELDSLYGQMSKSANMDAQEKAIRDVGKAMGWTNDQTVEWARTLNTVKPEVMTRFQTEAEKTAAEFRQLAVAAGAPEDAIDRLHATMLDTTAQKKQSDAFEKLRRQTGLTEDELRKLGVTAPASLNKVEAASKQTGTALSSLHRYAAMLGVTFSALTFAHFITGTQEARREMIAIERAFETLRGGAAGAADEVDSLRDMTARLGQNFYEVAPAFKGMLAAGQEAGWSIDELRELFEGTMEASTALGVSSERTGGMLLAFQQIISKGCHAKGTMIRMADGSVKAVERIAVGECLMGPSGEPKTVLMLARGREPMYRVTPDRGEPFVVNENHILRVMLNGIASNVTVKSLTENPETQRLARILTANNGLVPIVSIECVGVDNFYGFLISGDHLYQDSQGFIHHNTVSMEEARRQLGEHLPGAMNILAEAAGLPLDAFYNLVESGKASADILKNLGPLFTEMFGEAAQRAAQDSIATWNRFQEAVKDLRVAIGDELAPTFDAWVKMTTDYIRNNKEALASTFGAIASGAMNVVSAMVEHKEVLLAAAVGYTALKVAALASEAALTGVGKALMAHPLALVAAGAALLITALDGLTTSSAEAQQAFQAASNTAAQSASAYERARTSLESTSRAVEDYQASLVAANGDQEKEMAAVRAMEAVLPGFSTKYLTLAEAKAEAARRTEELTEAQSKELELARLTAFKDAETQLASLNDVMKDAANSVAKLETIFARLDRPGVSPVVLFSAISASGIDVNATLETMAGNLVKLEQQQETLSRVAPDSEALRRTEELLAQMRTLAERMLAVEGIAETERGGFLRKILLGSGSDFDPADAVSLYNAALKNAESLGTAFLAAAESRTATLAAAELDAQKIVLSAQEDSMSKRQKMLDLDATQAKAKLKDELTSGKIDQAKHDAELEALKIRHNAQLLAANTSFRQKEIEDSKRKAEEIAKTEEGLRDRLMQFSETALATKLRHLDEEFAAYKKSGVDTLLATKLYAVERSRILQEAHQKELDDNLEHWRKAGKAEEEALADSVAYHYKAIGLKDDEIRRHVEDQKPLLDRMLEEWTNTDKLIEESTRAMLQGIQQGFADTITKGLKGEFESLGDAWSSLMDSMINVFAQMVAQIASIWAVSNIGSLFSSSISGLSLSGAVGSLFGGTGSSGSGLNLLGGVGGGMTDKVANWLVTNLGSYPAGWSVTGASPTLLGVGAAGWSSALGAAGWGGLGGGLLSSLMFGGKGYSSIGGSVGGAVGTGAASLLASAGMIAGGPVGLVVGGLLGGLGGGLLGSLFGDEEEDDAETALTYFQQNLEKITSGQDGGLAYLDLVNQYEKSDNKARAQYGELTDIYKSLRAAGQLEWWAPDPETAKALGHLADEKFWKVASLGGGLEDHLDTLEGLEDVVEDLEEGLGPLANGLRGVFDGLDLAAMGADELAAVIEDRLNPAYLIQNELQNNLADGVTALTAHQTALNQTITSLLGTIDLSAGQQNELIDLLMRESGSVADLTAKYERYNEIQELLAKAHTMTRAEVEALVAEGRALHQSLGLETTSMADLNATMQELVATMKDLASVSKISLSVSTDTSGVYSALGELGSYHTGGIVGAALANGWITESGGSLPRFHDGLLPDEVAAVLQQGEAVIRRSSVNADTLPALRQINATGRAPSGNVTVAPVVNVNVSGDVISDSSAINRIAAAASKATQDGVLRAIKTLSEARVPVISSDGIDWRR